MRLLFFHITLTALPTKSRRLGGKSEETIAGYGSHLAALSLYFGCTPLELRTEDVHAYLYALQKRSKTPSQTFFKHTIYGLRAMLKSEGLPYDHFKLPQVRAEKTLPLDTLFAQCAPKQK